MAKMFLTLKSCFVNISCLLICALALYAVKVRAEAMQKAAELVRSGMLSVIGRPQAQYKYACVQAKEYCKSQGVEEPVCSVANYLFPDGRVIAGHQQVWSSSSTENVDSKVSFASLLLYLSSVDINPSKSVRISYSLRKEFMTKALRAALNFSCGICLFRLWISSSKTRDVSSS